MNYFEAVCMIQTKKRSAIAFDKDLFILSHNPKSTENHIATIVNPFMPGGNKRAYIRSKSLENMGFWNWFFILRRNSKRQEVLLTRELH